MMSAALTVPNHVRLFQGELGPQPPTPKTVTAVKQPAVPKQKSDPLGDYYAAAQGKEGAALLRALNGIVKQGHRDLGYARARDFMFGEVDDVAGNNQVADIYSGRVENNVDGRKSAFNKGLNAEHTWPQSQGATGIAQSDLHQLMPSDIDYNGRRGHLPFGEVKNVEFSTKPVSGVNGVSKLGSDANGETVWEPLPQVRGDIARGLLYFYTRYNTDKPHDYTLKAFNYELDTLIKWNQQDPVDPGEIERNERIHKVQGNRNPFVDHPEWVGAVGDAWKAGKFVTRNR